MNLPMITFEQWMVLETTGTPHARGSILVVCLDVATGELAAGVATGKMAPVAKKLRESLARYLTQ